MFHFIDVLSARFVTNDELIGVVAAALPCDLFSDPVVNDAANEKIGKKRDTQDGDGDIDRGEVRAGYARVEAPKSANPDEKQGPALPGDEPEDSQGEDGETDDESEVEEPPEGEGDGFGEEEGEIFGPAFDHVSGGAVHAGGEGIGS